MNRFTGDRVNKSVKEKALAIRSEEEESVEI